MGGSEESLQWGQGVEAHGSGGSKNSRKGGVLKQDNGHTGSAVLFLIFGNHI